LHNFEFNDCYVENNFLLNKAAIRGKSTVKFRQTPIFRK
jgi:hypothetical protein